jgi:preprotein translocase subunit SecG
MFWAYVMMFVLLITGFALMFVILLQRGRGGGLAGALGGMGGQSAFGTKAGDVFTKITVVIAVIWVVLAGTSGWVLRAGLDGRDPFAEQVEGRPQELQPGPGDDDPFDLGTLEEQQRSEQQPPPDPQPADPDAAASDATDGPSLSPPGDTDDQSDPAALPESTEPAP